MGGSLAAILRERAPPPSSTAWPGFNITAIDSFRRSTSLHADSDATYDHWARFFHTRLTQTF